MSSPWFKHLINLLEAKLKGRHGLQAIIGNAGWLFIDKIIRMGVGLFVGVWIARYLGPEQYGMWNFAIAFAALFSFFATLGLEGIVVRELVKSPERKNEILGSAFVLKFIGGAIAFLIAIFAILLMSNDEVLTLWLVGISAAGFIFQSMNVIDFYFQAKVQSKYTVYASNGAFILMALIKILLLLSSAPLVAFALAGLGEIALTAVFLIAAYLTNHQNIREWVYKRKVAHELLRNSWPLILSGLAVMLYMRVDMVMLKVMMGEREVGIYAAATRLSEIWYFLPMVVVASVLPSIIKCRNTNHMLYIHRLRKLYFFMACLAVGISLPLSLLSDWIVGMLYGQEFKEAGPVLAIHLWASIAVFLGVASSQYLLVENLQKISFYRTVIGLIFNIILNLILIPKFGAVGAAIATVISYFVSTFSIAFFKSTRTQAIYLLTAPFGRY